MTAPAGAYADLGDVYMCLSAQAFALRGRPFEAVDIATGIIRLTAHGLSASDLVRIDVTSGGALPTGVSAFTYYAVVPVGADLFRLDGFTSFAAAGSGWSVVVDSARRIEWHLVDEAAQINQRLTAHAPPIVRDVTTGLYPRVLIGLNARRAARAAVTSLQVENAAYRVAVDRLFAQDAEDKDLLGEYLKGLPVRPDPTDQTPAPDNGAMAASSRRAVCWQTGML